MFPLSFRTSNATGKSSLSCFPVNWIINPRAYSSALGLLFEVLLHINSFMCLIPLQLHILERNVLGKRHLLSEAHMSYKCRMRSAPTNRTGRGSEGVGLELQRKGAFSALNNGCVLLPGHRWRLTCSRGCAQAADWGLLILPRHSLSTPPPCCSAALQKHWHLIVNKDRSWWLPCGGIETSVSVSLAFFLGAERLSDIAVDSRAWQVENFVSWV